MSRRSVDSEGDRHGASAAIARAHLLDLEADRPKRIDQYLDYFGEGGPSARRAPREEPSPPGAAGETSPTTQDG